MWARAALAALGYVVAVLVSVELSAVALMPIEEAHCAPMGRSGPIKIIHSADQPTIVRPSTISVRRHAELTP
jgi:hypothetical protein